MRDKVAFPQTVASEFKRLWTFARFNPKLDGSSGNAEARGELLLGKVGHLDIQISLAKLPERMRGIADV